MLITKKLLIILILFITHQSIVKANTISDFQIEGISIGDSLLKYASNKEIVKYMITDYNSDLYSRFTIRQNDTLKFQFYDDIQVHFKTRDKDYIIVSISGGIYNDNEFDNCLKKKETIIKDVSKMFPEARINDVGTSAWLKADPSGETVTSQFFLNIGNDIYNDYIEIACYDWGEEAGNKFNASDHLKVGINTKIFDQWLQEEAW